MSFMVQIKQKNCGLLRQHYNQCRLVCRSLSYVNNYPNRTLTEFLPCSDDLGTRKSVGSNKFMKDPQASLKMFKTANYKFQTLIAESNELCKLKIHNPIGITLNLHCDGNEQWDIQNLIKNFALYSPELMGMWPMLQSSFFYKVGSYFILAKYAVRVLLYGRNGEDFAIVSEKNTRCQVIFTRWKQTCQLCPCTACVGWENFLCIFSMGFNVWLWFEIWIWKQEIWQMSYILKF